MLSQRLYYAVKPCVPLQVRRRVRGLFAQRLRTARSDVWPIDATAGQTPLNWPGWPDGKKFAVVLTHDVEGREGLAKHRHLAELEMECGFRSSFNFVPEGEYSVTREQRERLMADGFEVGIHDLHHNGKLFHSERKFEAHARKINHYIKEWSASGFRAGFMLRNLDWFHYLDIQYDASTFDTDPFEPMPDGVGTIFPFWRSIMHDRDEKSFRNSGYAELPYTVPQDSTLYFILGETDPRIWIQKADWIAEKGGVVLINVHPDYIQFPGDPTSSLTYPASHYRTFLEHLKQTYEGQYWQPLPKQMAQWVSQHRTTLTRPHRVSIPFTPSAKASSPYPQLIGKRAAVLLYSEFPDDPRPRRAAEAMAEAGMQVDFFCLSGKEGDALKEQVGGIAIHRVRLRKKRGSRFEYILQYGRFINSAFWFLFRRGLVHKYDVVHVHNMPDILVFSASIAKLRGAKVVLDLHDPMPELMMSIYSLTENHSFVRWLRRLERWSIKFSDLVLTPNLSFKKLFISRGCPTDKLNIVMNTPQEGTFAPDSRANAEKSKNKPFRIMHHGSIVHRHGLDLLVAAVAKAHERAPEIHLDFYGARNGYLDEIMQQAAQLGLSEFAHFHGAKNHEEIAAAIKESDLGVIPNRRSSFTNLNFPTRIFEFLAMGCPVISPATQGIQDYFNAEDMIFFEPDNVADLADRIIWVYENRDKAEAIALRGAAVYRHHLWSEEKSRFLQMVSTLTTRS